MTKYISELNVSLNAQDEENLKKQGFSYIHTDLNKGTKGNRIYLWYKTSPAVSDSITRIQFTFMDEMEKGLKNSGFQKIAKDLNTGAGGDKIFLWFSTVASDYSIPIVGLRVTTDVDTEAKLFKDGWERLACDLNRHAGGNYIYLWVKREKTAYICDVAANIKFNNDAKMFMDGYIRVDENTNRDAGGNKIFIWYRQSTDEKNTLKVLQISTDDEQQETFKNEGYTSVDVDLNELTGGNRVYMWYKEDDPKDHVTSVTIITNKDAVEEYKKQGVTVNEQSLNTGNKGAPVYLCYYP